VFNALSLTTKFTLSDGLSFRNHLPSIREIPNTSMKFSSTPRLLTRGCISGLLPSHMMLTVPFTKLVGISDTTVNRAVEGFRSSSDLRVRYFDQRSPVMRAYTRFSLSKPRFLSWMYCSWLYTTAVPTSSTMEIVNCATTSVLRNALLAAPALRLPFKTLDGRKPERNNAG